MQAILFYAPRWLWKNWEGGKLHALSKDLRVGYLSKEEKADKREMLVDYLQENLNNHRVWAGRYMLCEVLALINVTGQLFYMNYFLGGEFWSYGPRVLNFMASDDWDTPDPKEYVFPKMVKCTFHKYGASGAMVRYDSICVLPLNILNGRFYTFISLLILTLVWLTFAISIIPSSKFRIYILRKRFGRIERNTIARLERYCSTGDWFLFCMLAENLDSNIFRDVMESLLVTLGKQKGSMVELTEESGTL